MGSVYETVVATELAAYGHRLFYYDNRKRGEVDFLIDDYHVASGIVLSNERIIKKKNKITYMPIYYVMFL